MPTYNKKELQEFQRELEKIGEIEKMTYAEFKKYYEQRKDLQARLKEELNLLRSEKSSVQALTESFQDAATQQQIISRLHSNITDKTAANLQAVLEIEKVKAETLNHEVAIDKVIIQEVQHEKEIQATVTQTNKEKERQQRSRSPFTKQERAITPPTPSPAGEKMEVEVNLTGNVPTPEISPVQQLTVLFDDFVKSLSTIVKVFTTQSNSVLNQQQQSTTKTTSTLNNITNKQEEVVSTGTKTINTVANQQQQFTTNTTSTATSLTSLSEQQQAALSNNTAAINNLTSQQQETTDINSKLVQQTNQTLASQPAATVPTVPGTPITPPTPATQPTPAPSPATKPQFGFTSTSTGSPSVTYPAQSQGPTQPTPVAPPSPTPDLSQQANAAASVVVSSKKAREEAIQRLVQERVITKEQGKSEETFNRILEAVEIYKSNISDVEEDVAKQVVNYADIKVDMAGMQQATDILIKKVKEVSTEQGAYKTILGGIPSIQRSINKQAEDLVYNQTRLTEGELTSREVQSDLGKTAGTLIAISLQRKLIDDRILQINQEMVGASKDKIDALSSERKALGGILDQLTTAEKSAEKLTEQFQIQAKEASKIETKIGLAGKLLGGLKKVPVLGDLLDFGGAEKAMRSVAANGGKSFQVLAAGASALGPSLAAALGPLTLILLGIQAIVAVTKFFVNAMIEADKQVTDISKSLGIGKKEAEGVRERFFDIKNSANDLGGLIGHQILLQKEVAENAAKFNEILGTSLDLTEAQGESGQRLLRQFTAINKFLKLNDEEQKGLLAISLSTGKEIDRVRNTILGTAQAYRLTNGYQVNSRKILKDVLTTSNYIRASFKGSLEELTKSAIEAQKFGSNLNRVNEISKGFLDFESSIQKEMEAEVLTGRELSLEKIRYYSLTRQQGKVTEELNRLIREAGPDIENNAIAFQSVAESINMTEGELTDYITALKQSDELKAKVQRIDEETLENLRAGTNLTVEQIKALQQQMATGAITGYDFYKKLQDAGASVKYLTDALGEQAVLSYGAQSAQEKFNEALESAKESFTTFVTGGSLEKLANGLANLATYLEGGIWGMLSGETAAKIQEKEAKREVGKAAEVGVSEEQVGAQISKGEVYLQAFVNSLAHPITGITRGFQNIADLFQGREMTSLKEAREMLRQEYATELAEAKRAEAQAKTPTTATPSQTATPQATTSPKAQGGEITRGGMMVAQVHEGELISGMNTRDSFIQTYKNSEKLLKAMASNKELLQAIREQNQLLVAIRDKDTNIHLDGEKIGSSVSYAVGRQVVQDYGNLLNPNSRV